MRLGDTYRIPLPVKFRPFRDNAVVCKTIEAQVESLAASAFSAELDYRDGMAVLEEELAKALLDRGMVAVEDPQWSSSVIPEYLPSKLLTVSILCVKWPEGA